MDKHRRKTIIQIWLVTLAMFVAGVVGYFFVSKGAGLSILAISTFVAFMNALVLFGERTKQEYKGGNMTDPTLDLQIRLEKAIQLGKKTGAHGNHPSNIYVLAGEALEALKTKQSSRFELSETTLEEQDKNNVVFDTRFFRDMSPALLKSRAISFTYTNYRNETSVRRAVIIRAYWGSTDWHPENGVLLRAFDLDKQEIREFALKDCDFTNGETAFRAGFEDGADWQATHERGNPTSAVGIDEAFQAYKSSGDR